MAFHLREYQEELIEAARQAIRDGCKSMMLVMPTGGGKTCVSGTIIGNSASRGNDAWFMNHRRELLRQSSLTFHKVGIDHAIVGAGFPMQPSSRVQICGVQTVVNRLDKFRAPRLIVWDECHHIAAGQWAKIFAEYPDAIHIGVTATPCRLDGAGLGDWFQRMIMGPSMRWLIDNGFLSKYRLVGPPSPVDFSGVSMRAGSDNTEGQAERLDKPQIIGDVIDHYRRLVPGKRAIVFAANISHSKHVVEQFNEAGIPAAHLDGTMDARHRDATLAAFERGDIKVLSNVNLFGEGFDVPSIEAVILLRRTMSLGLYLQMVGRALRPAEGKDYAWIIDHCGNWILHGLPDEDRTWSLDPKEKVSRAANDNEDELKIKQCPECYAVHEPAPRCPFCGHEYEVKTRRLEQVDGELEEVDVEAMRRAARAEQGQAETLEELTAVGKARGMKHAKRWAQHVLEGRRRKEAAEEEACQTHADLMRLASRRGYTNPRVWATVKLDERARAGDNGFRRFA